MSDFSTVDASKWLIPIRKESSPKTRLICFHWVGGNAFVYRPWRKELPGNIEIYSMMMPGRLSRRGEAFVESVNEVVHQILLSMQVLGLTGDNQPPTVFFGHSYGGIIAYELALQLQKQRLLSVAHLIVSSTNSPQVLTSRSQSNDDAFYKKFFLLSDRNLLEELISQGALLGGVHIDILRASLPIIRADYKGLENYISLKVSASSSCEHVENDDNMIVTQVCDEKKVVADQNDCKYSGPLTVWGGSDDLHNVSEESLLGWSDHVKAEKQFTFKLYKGSHFYFSENEAKSEFMEELTKICLTADA